MEHDWMASELVTELTDRLELEPIDIEDERVDKLLAEVLVVDEAG